MAKGRPPSPSSQSGKPQDPLMPYVQQALALHAQGQLDRAEAGYRAVLSRAPAHFDALHLLGVLEHQRGRHDQAITLIRQALRVDAKQCEAHSNLGLALQHAGRMPEALASFDRALTLKPDSAGAHFNRGNALREMGRTKDAIISYDRALRLKPDSPETHNNRAIALQELGRADEALAGSDRALALKAGFAEAHNTRGLALRALGRFDEALASYDSALAAQPGFVSARFNQGNALRALLRHDDALAAYDAALAARPAFVEALVQRAHTLRDLQRLDDAIAGYDRALVLAPESTEALFDRGMTLQLLGRHDEAAQAFARVLEVDPRHAFTKGRLLYAKMLACDWDGLAALASSLRDDVRAKKPVVAPFAYQAISTSPGDLRLCAEVYATARYPAVPRTWPAERTPRSKLRIGYLSGEFREQATSLLMTEVWERHDRDRFELVAFDNGFGDGSDTRRRIEGAFAEMVDITRLDDRSAADAIHAGGIDILVNLNGYFGLGRSGVFAHRPAPLQVNYLGFPGTLGANYIDYLVADAHVIPPSHDAYYREAIVRLPDSYQANPSSRPIAARTPTRAELGLPQHGFVFCSFNSSYKTTPEVFQVWMRLLGAVPGSVLWLLDDNPAASRNLRREATTRGVAAERLIFAPRMQLDEHLARHRVADLFLDTLPCNAHTTASDALWAGLPLLTCVGETFAARVAASLLHAVGLPDLVTRDLAHYEAHALHLATTPSALNDVRTRLSRNTITHPLFDTGRFARHLEAAYDIMWERRRRGEKPGPFDVMPTT